MTSVGVAHGRRQSSTQMFIFILHVYYRIRRLLALLIINRVDAACNGHLHAASRFAIANTTAETRIVASYVAWLKGFVR